MPLLLDADIASRRRVDVAHLSVGFVNIMPDGAFDTTERQFFALMEAGAAGTTIHVRRYTLPGVRRSPDMERQVGSRYLPVDELWMDPPDALILTGTEPCEAHLQAEPYWESLADLIRWASCATVSTMLSCLAAHAAILLFDGVERERLPRKVSGVFDHTVVASHALVEGLGDLVAVPHSRVNHVAADGLAERGYSILLESAVAGWSLAADRAGGVPLRAQSGPSRVRRDQLAEGVSSRRATISRGRSARPSGHP